MSDVILLTQGQVRKCEPISTAAAYRTDVATVVSQMEQDAKLWDTALFYSRSGSFVAADCDESESSGGG